MLLYTQAMVGGLGIRRLVSMECSEQCPLNSTLRSILYSKKKKKKLLKGHSGSRLMIIRQRTSL